MHVIRASDQTRMPWKNGAGETIEVAVHPPGASMTGFGWRVSTAPFTADGAFSCFEGVDRTLAVLSGEGVVLDVEGADAVTVTPGGAPHAFPGDVPTVGRLLGGPALNLNVMTRRGAFRHRIDVRTLAGAATFTVDARWTLALPLGPVRLDVGGWVDLASGDAVVAEAGDAPIRLASVGPVPVYVVAIDPA